MFFKHLFNKWRSDKTNNLPAFEIYGYSPFELSEEEIYDIDEILGYPHKGTWPRPCAGPSVQEPDPGGTTRLPSIQPKLPVIQPKPSEGGPLVKGRIHRRKATRDSSNHGGVDAGCRNWQAEERAEFDPNQASAKNAAIQRYKESASKATYVSSRPSGYTTSNIPREPPRPPACTTSNIPREPPHPPACTMSNIPHDSPRPPACAMSSTSREERVKAAIARVQNNYVSNVKNLYCDDVNNTGEFERRYSPKYIDPIKPQNQVIWDEDRFRRSRRVTERIQKCYVDELRNVAAGPQASSSRNELEIDERRREMMAQKKMAEVERAIQKARERGREAEIRANLAHQAPAPPASHLADDGYSKRKRKLKAADPSKLLPDDVFPTPPTAAPKPPTEKRSPASWNSVAAKRGLGFKSKARQAAEEAAAGPVASMSDSTGKAEKKNTLY